MRIPSSPVLFALPFVLGLVACTGAPDEDTGHAPYPEKECGNGLWGERFTSENELECGLGADGIAVPCHWSVTFGEETFVWAHSDVEESGTVTCSDTALVGVTASGQTIEGNFHRATARVTWAGEIYDHVVE